MDRERKFSDVSHAYNANLANLDEARQIFENEMRKLIDYVAEHANVVARRAGEDEKFKDRLRWEPAEDRSSQKSGPWANFSARTAIALDVRPPRAVKFKNRAAFLIFEIFYDANETKQFVFQCLFENENTVNDTFDEKLYELVRAAGEPFTHAEHYKSDDTILFRKPIEDGLLDQITALVDAAVRISQEAVAQVLPDSLYVPAAPPAPAAEVPEANGLLLEKTVA